MNFSDFHFIRPFWLFALIPAIIIFYLSFKKKLNQNNWSQVCDNALLPYIVQNQPEAQRQTMLISATLASILSIIALAGPSWEKLPSPVFRNEAALVIALDLSRSMDATDIKPSRLTRARYKISDILQQRKDGQTALIVYAGDAFTVSPLTEDNETINSQLNALTTEIMPTQGSQTDRAIEQAKNLLKQAGLQQGDIVLITDEIETENIENSLKKLDGYRLSILGVGTEEGAPIKAVQGGFVKDKQGTIIIPKLNPQQLSQVSSQNNGIYRSISDDESDVQALLDFIDQPRSQTEQESDRISIENWQEKGPWLFMLIIPLAALQFRKGILSLLLLLTLPYSDQAYALDWQDLWQTQNQQAQQAYQQNQYEKAAEKFQDQNWKAAAHYKAGQYDQAIELLKNETRAESLYNLGNAYAKTGQYQAALDAYDQSLKINPDNQDAEYNKAEVKKALQQQQDDSSESNNDQNEQSEQENSQNESAEPDQQNTNQAENNDNQQDQQNQAQTEQTDEQSEPTDQTEHYQAEQSETDYDEEQQASEQWLKRIPDDPAGLLKRKFKYQYGQRKRSEQSQKNW